MRNEYLSLKNVAWQYRFLGWVVGIIIVLLGGVSSLLIFGGHNLLFVNTIDRVLAGTLCLLLTGIVTWLEVATFRAVSEFIYLCIRVEYNTRQRPQPQMVYQQPAPHIPQPRPQLNAPENYQQPVQETQQYYQQPTQENQQQYSPEQAQYYMPPENTEEQQ